MNKSILWVGGAVAAAVLLFIFIPKVKEAKSEAKVSSSAVVKDLYAKASTLKKNNEIVKARETYQEIMTNYPDAENIATVEKELSGVNMDILFSGVEVTGKTVFYEVALGDTLGKIAKKHNTTTDMIKRGNNLKSDVIQVGQKLRIWNSPFNVFVDKSQNILILKDGNEIMKIYNVSTGTNNSTPVGKFKVISKLVDPVWFKRGAVVSPDSPDNALGSRWMGFDLPGYGIHGTIEPESIGKQVTAGCVRMRNEEVEELYSIIPTGTEVVIVD